MVEPEKGAGTKFWDRRSKAKTSGKWSREIKSKNFALSSSSSFSETQRGYQKARTAEGHYTAFHGERCGIDPKLRPSTEDHPGPVYCDRTGRGTRPGWSPRWAPRRLPSCVPQTEQCAAAASWQRPL